MNTDGYQALSNRDASLIGHALSMNELFSSWPLEARTPLIRVARLGRYPRKADVLAHDRAARELLVVVSGCLEIGGTSPDGRKYLHALMRPSSVSPLTRLLEDVPQPLDYSAHVDSVILHLPVPAVLEQLGLHPELWRGVAYLALQRQRYSVAYLSRLLLGTLEQRLAVMLVKLAQLYGQEGPEGVDLEIRLSQQDLAALLGVSRQTMNRALRTFIDLGLLRAMYNRITVLDMLRLQTIADGDPARQGLLD